MARASHLLQIDSLEFSYGSVQVLFGVNLQVPQGEMVALLGTNGAGKTTLLRAVCGLARPTSGDVLFDGTEVTGCDVVEMVDRGVVLMAGGRAVFPDMTVAENLEIGAYSLRKQGEVAADRISRTAELFPWMTERWRTAAGALSGGEQQQLGLAKSLLLEPRLLCIDELSLGLAPTVVADLLEVVRKVHAAGTTIVLVEQSLNVAARLCTRSIFLEKGAVRFDGATADLLERNDVARAVFLGGEAKVRR